MEYALPATSVERNVFVYVLISIIFNSLEQLLNFISLVEQKPESRHEGTTF